MESTTPYRVTAICEAPGEASMTLDGYQLLALETAVYPEEHRITYPALGLAGEAGEVADIEDEVLKRYLIELNAEIFEKFLVWLTKTHCIVSREKVKEGYEGWRVFLGTKDEDKAMAAMWELEELFGTELFEERSEE